MTRPPNFAWLDHIGCRGADPTEFDTQDPQLVAHVKGHYCRPCPVVAECLADALRLDGRNPVTTSGIRGGLTADERARLPRTRPLPPIRHGTVAGHQSHRGRGEQPCTDCKTAMAAYMRARRAQPKETT